MRRGTHGHVSGRRFGNGCLARSVLLLVLPVGFLTTPIWSGVGPAAAADTLTFDAPVQTSGSPTRPASLV